MADVRHGSGRSRSTVLGKRPNARATAIDLFCGCGGLTLGLRLAGFSVLGAVEIDPLAVESFRLNHRRVRIWQEDIWNLDPHEMRRDIGLRRGELDLLAGCPPCQGFSRIRTRNRGKRIRDIRNALLFRFLDFVEELRPQAVLMENVPGLEFYYRFAEFKARLISLGYACNHGVLDARDFGVPQRRKRLVVIAARRRLVAFATPQRCARTVRDAIRSLPRPGRSGDPLHDTTGTHSQRIQSMIEKIPQDGGSRSDLGPRAQLACHRETAGFYDVYGRMAWDGVAPTLTAEFVNPSKGRFLHPVQHRAITLREALLLQSFPPDYKLSLRLGRYPAARMIGNAFPPEFARRQAAAVRRSLNGGG